jgi:hypothetical protein
MVILGRAISIAAPLGTCIDYPMDEAMPVSQWSQARRTRSQRLASRRLTPIRTPNEVINLTAAAMNVGVDTGDKADAVTSVWCMVNTFSECSWFW